MPEEQDQVMPETESSEEGPLQQSDATQEEAPASSEPQDGDGAATGEPTPSVSELQKQLDDYQATINKQNEAYNELMSRHQVEQNELLLYRQAQQEELARLMSDREAWQEKLADPTEGPKLLQMIASQQLNARDQQMQQLQAQVAWSNATSEFDRWATTDPKGPKMSPAELQSFHSEGPVYNTPEQAVAGEKLRARGLYVDRIVPKVVENAEAVADKKARQKLANQLPDGAGAQTPGDMSVTDQWKALMGGGEGHVENVVELLKD